MKMVCMMSGRFAPDARPPVKTVYLLRGREGVWAAGENPDEAFRWLKAYMPSAIGAGEFIANISLKFMATAVWLLLDDGRWACAKDRRAVFEPEPPFASLEEACFKSACMGWPEPRLVLDADGGVVK